MLEGMARLEGLFEEFTTKGTEIRCVAAEIRIQTIRQRRIVVACSRVGFIFTASGDPKSKRSYANLYRKLAGAFIQGIRNPIGHGPKVRGKQCELLRKAEVENRTKFAVSSWGNVAGANRTLSLPP